MSTIKSRRPAGYRLVWLTPERLAIYPRLFVLVYAILIGFGLLQSQGAVMPSGKPIGYDFIAFWSASWLAGYRGSRPVRTIRSSASEISSTAGQIPRVS